MEHNNSSRFMRDRDNLAEPELNKSVDDFEQGLAESETAESSGEEEPTWGKRMRETIQNTRVLLPQDEFNRLRREGPCFNCKVKGYLSRNCPETQEEVEANDVETASEGEEDDENSPAAMEANAARFTDQDTEDEMANFVETDSSSSPEDSGTDDL
ncbi:hypothetical protein B0H16DRAFT_1485402 [Mycena metata]|uniref:CCHC-type domain-containing protein n=1 Tax=Mycena metata TaxID=1033252 RepID=A0AAD7DP79_9AGAR|nr:hypothetical protein B0H16DRAFT_1485402 [Mycena metata]